MEFSGGELRVGDVLREQEEKEHDDLTPPQPRSEREQEQEDAGEYGVEGSGSRAAASASLLRHPASGRRPSASTPSGGRGRGRKVARTTTAVAQTSRREPSTRSGKQPLTTRKWPAAMER